MTLQLYLPCKVAVHMCNAGIPMISDLICSGSFDYCQSTQARWVQAGLGLWLGIRLTLQHVELDTAGR